MTAEEGSCGSPRPIRIAIPSLGIDTPIVPSGLEVAESGGFPEPAWVVPESTRTGWQDTSATLGVRSNTVIYGHRWPQDGVFRDLYQIELGALIILYAGEKTFGYEVVAAIIVKEAGQPLEVRQANACYLMPTQDERVTVATCHPYGSRRETV